METELSNQQNEMQRVKGAVIEAGFFLSFKIRIGLKDILAFLVEHSICLQNVFPNLHKE